jgi:hypothetical protein
MSITVKILLAVILLHFIVGFGYLIYKLSPRKKDEDATEDAE